jgi:hypothetical protein
MQVDRKPEMIVGRKYLTRFGTRTRIALIANYIFGVLMVVF